MASSTENIETLVTPDGIPVASPAGTYTVSFFQTLANLGTDAIDLVGSWVPGHNFKVVGLAFRTAQAGTGSGASQVFSLEIGSTNVTGGVLTLTLASQQAGLGTITAATAITAGDEGSSTDAITLEMAAGGTAFTAGAGDILLTLQNLDG